MARGFALLALDLEYGSPTALAGRPAQLGRAVEITARTGDQASHGIVTVNPVIVEIMKDRFRPGPWCWGQLVNNATNGTKAEAVSDTTSCRGAVEIAGRIEDQVTLGIVPVGGR